MFGNISASSNSVTVVLPDLFGVLGIVHRPGWRLTNDTAVCTISQYALTFHYRIRKIPSPPLFTVNPSRMKNDKNNQLSDKFLYHRK